jgi:hypothetical protein
MEAGMSGKFRAIVTVVLWLVFAVNVRASIFLSTNRDTDELVLINSVSGDVTAVGPLGFDAVDVDLAMLGTRLFALNTNFQVRVDLHEINPATGAAISSAQVHTVSGVVTTNVLNAEGLSQVNGQLKIGFRVEPAPFPTRSNGLGDLALDGLITNVQTNASSFTNPGLDFDSLGTNDAGTQLYGTDGAPSDRPNDTDFYTASESPLSVSVFFTNGTSNRNLDDVVIHGNTLFAIGNDELHFLDLTTNAFSSLSLDPGQYDGLALASAGIPEMSSVFVWGIGILSCCADRRRYRVAAGDNR